VGGQCPASALGLELAKGRRRLATNRLGYQPGVAEDRNKWLWYVVPIAFVAGGALLWFIDRQWLVDLLDAPDLPSAGNVALGVAVGAGWYVFAIIVFLVRKLSGRTRPSTAMAVAQLWIFAALGAFAIAAFPNRRGGRAYNDALSDQVPGFSMGLLAGAIPLLVLGLLIWLASKALDWHTKRNRDAPAANR
jgi:hypothetical protein